MRRTTASFDTDDRGLAALRAERDDLVLEAVVSPDRYRCAEGPFDHYERKLDVETTGPGRHRVTETTNWSLAIPIWGGLFRPLVGRMLHRHAEPSPAPPEDGAAGHEFRSPWWSPPARFDARSAQVLSRLCFLSLLAGYLGTIISQTLTFAADEYGSSTTAQGTTLALIRVGVLLSVGIMALADRRGRQRLLVVTAVAATVFAAVGALSPNLVVLGSTQMLSRACSTALALLIAVVAAEEMPAGGRAYGASVLAMTGGLGASISVMLLPLADLAPWAWRVIYVFPLLFLPAFVAVGRQLPESRRFVRPHGKATMAGHRRRLALLATVAFFGLLFWAPASQFQNDFLRDEHGFSAPQLTLFTLATTTPAGIGIIVGGRLADTRGRRLVGAVGTVGGAILLAATYLVGGPLLWVCSTVGSIIAAVTVPALAVYGPELFPTVLRARANGLISVAGVAGSATGLMIGGRMEDHFGSYGPGLAMLALGPFLVAALVLALYPETAHLELEELNPEDAIGAALPVIHT